MTIAIALRVRGTRGISRSINDTLANIRLGRKHSCVLLELSDSAKGMLQKANNYIAWGNADEKSVELLLSKRGMEGNKPLSPEFYKKIKVADAKELAAAIVSQKISLKTLFEAGLRPLFRLSPPRKGYGGMKLQQPRGPLGFHKQGLTQLIERMV